MLELYHWEPNQFFLKPLIALAEKGAAYRSHWFDPTQFEQFGAEFPTNVESRLQLEREGPLLVHDGTIVSSSFFMLEYIAEALPGPSLIARAPVERYRMRAFGQAGALLLGGAVATLGCARYLAPALRARDQGPLRASIAAIEPVERRGAWLALLEGEDAAAISAAASRLALPVKRIEAALAASEWLTGADYTIADIDAFATLQSLPGLAPQVVNPSDTPRIVEFLERMRARPAVRAALSFSRCGHPEQAFVPGPEASRWG